MTVMKLDHVNIRTPRLEETVRFYAEVLGMTAGPSPGGGDGSWIYDDGGAPVIHLGRSGKPMPGDGLRSSRGASEGSGVVDHVAFECGDHDAFAARLDGLGIVYQPNHVERMNLRQIFLRDPNDILVELNFR